MGASILTNWRSLHLPRSPKDSFEQDFNNMDRFLEKLGSLSEQGTEPPRLVQDQVGMRQKLQEELEKARALLKPYRAKRTSRWVGTWRGCGWQLKPYTTDLMEQVALRVQERQEQLRLVGEDTKTQVLRGVDEARGLLQQLQKRVAHHTSRMKALFHPYVESLMTSIRHHVQETHRSVAPHAAASPVRLSRCVQVLSRKLTLTQGSACELPAGPRPAARRAQCLCPRRHRRRGGKG